MHQQNCSIYKQKFRHEMNGDLKKTYKQTTEIKCKQKKKSKPLLMLLLLFFPHTIRRKKENQNEQKMN